MLKSLILRAVNWVKSEPVALATAASVIALLETGEPWQAIAAAILGGIARALVTPTVKA